MFKIIKNFPGGNIHINSIEDNVVHLEQEIRDTGEWWFWWNFKIKVQKEMIIDFKFDNGAVVHKKGVCCRFENEDFFYDSESRINASEILFHFNKPGTWQFSFSIPYQVSDWNKFLMTLDKRPSIKTVGYSKEGRPFEIIDENSNQEKNIVITCRHHACESVAAFSMEGLVKYILENDFFKKYRIIVFPFVDIDGVENGDQGKSRLPHDHNRDYIDKPLYESVRILKEYAKNTICLFDMHCPASWGGVHDHLSLIGLEHPYDVNQQIFSEILKKVTNEENCPIDYDPQNNVPCGTLWNKGIKTSCSGYFAEHGARLAFSFEHPFAGDMQKPYSKNDLRFFGRCFGIAVLQFLKRI